MRFTKSLLRAAVIAALAPIAPRGAFATAPHDFTLGPGGKVTISVDVDPSRAGCSSADISECDRYSLKIPITVNAGDLSDDLNSGGNNILVLGFGVAGMLCAGISDVFYIAVSESSLILTKTKTTLSAKFTGSAEGFGIDGMFAVPTTFMIKASRSTGKGTMIVKGVGQGLSGLSGATVDVALAVGEAAGDGDIDRSCATVPAAFIKTP